MTPQKYPNWLRQRLLWGLILLSVFLTIYDGLIGGRLWSHIHELGYLSGVLVVTEACFIAGALIMALSAGESFAGMKIRHWPKHIRYLRREARTLAGRLLSSRLFAVGFWLNFVGAVGTSAVLILGILLFVPQAGWGVLVLIILDLIATFGWRIPLHLERRKIIKRKKL